MTLVFEVLRCFNCEKFQIHQTKKAKKWCCKVCGEKQAYIKVFFTGSAKECRPVVQELNFQAGERKTAQIFEGLNHISDKREFKEEYPLNKCANKRLKRDSITSIEKEFEAVSNCFSFDENFSSDNHSSQTTVYHDTPVSPVHYKKTTISFEEKLIPSNVSSPIRILKTNNENDFVLKPKIERKRPSIIKNKGFQKILEAAKRAS